MTPKTPNFTAYDFLGYTVPGLAAIALLDASIFYHSKGTHFTFDLAVSRYLHLNLASLVPVLLISYLIGHILGFVSSVLIEKHATWMHGVPTNYLLGHGKHSGYFDTAGEVPIASKFLRILSAAMIAPVSVIDGFLTKVIPLSKNYIRPLILFWWKHLHQRIRLFLRSLMLTLRSILKSNWIVLMCIN